MTRLTYTSAMAANAKHDLGALRAFETEAVGEPGQRRFRLRAVTEEMSASLWLEKEQVRALSTAIQQILSQNRRSGDGKRPPSQPLGAFPLNAELDFQVGRLALAYDKEAEVLAIYATDVEAGQEAPVATLRATFTRDQARLFSAQADETVDAGRSLCPLCKEPVDGYDHLCPASNGHSDDAMAWVPPPELY